MSSYDAMIHAYLDGVLDEPHTIELEQWLRQDAAHLSAFVRESFLHRQLRDELVRLDVLNVQNDMPQLNPADSAAVTGMDAGMLLKILAELERRAPASELVRLDDHAAEDSSLQAADVQPADVGAATTKRRRRTAAIFSFAGIRLYTGVEREATAYGFKPRYLAYAALFLAAIIFAAIQLWPKGEQQRIDQEQGSSQLAHADSETPQPETPDPRPEPRPIVATVGKTVAATWNMSAVSLESGVKLREGGRFKLTGGTIEIIMTRGTRVVLEGPCVVELRDDNALRLDRGRLVAHVPQQARYFTVETPTATVVDLGTVFGVEVRDDHSTQTVVFEGDVDLVANQRQQPTRLGAGRMATVGADGDMMPQALRQVSQEERQLYWREVLPLIERVEVNNDAGEYPVLHYAMDEDVKAFADRPHEWNGIDADGMPDYLLGAHVVQPRGDDKDQRDLKITLHLLSPAEIYVFFDESRTRVPQWLEAHYQRLPERIGLDEGPWEKGRDNILGVGPGMHVDTPMTIWRRVVAEPGPITLGRSGTVKPEHAPSHVMYGIAVKRLSANTANTANIVGRN